MGRSTRSYTELAGRTQPLLGDVVIAMASMGVGFDKLQLYAHRANRPALRPPSYPSTPRMPVQNTMRVGPYFIPPQHVPRFFPPFPAAHTWISTMTHKEPITEYALLREKEASTKRSFQTALTKFIMSVSTTESLFREQDVNVFPLIMNKPLPKPYLSALLPKDQVFKDSYKLQDYEEDASPSKVTSVNPFLRSPRRPGPDANIVILTPKKKYQPYLGIDMGE